MKTFLSILIIFISLQSWTKANDISEFEIEGISVGDSLNKFFNEKEISDAVDESYEDKTYITKTFYEINLKNYEAIQATFKAKDKKRIIVSIVGVIGYPNNIPDCKKEMNNIDIELINLFPKAMRKNLNMNIIWKIWVIIFQLLMILKMDQEQWFHVMIGVNNLE